MHIEREELLVKRSTVFLRYFIGLCIGSVCINHYLRFVLGIQQGYQRTQTLLVQVDVVQCTTNSGSMVAVVLPDRLARAEIPQSRSVIR